LSLVDAGGTSLCQPWDLSTFPAPGTTRDRLRVLFFTCAGGLEGRDLNTGFLPTAVRNRLLRRGLSFGPDVAVANGDHVYWDLHARGGGPAAARRLASFPRSALVFGDTNETVLKLAAGPQIVPVYGTDFRSTPVFFLQDDHDYYDNDEGTDAIVTFPPPWFQLQLARATQRMYYPEFLPDLTRPAGLPWSSSGDRGEGLSESFGTLRFGSLVEILLYDVRRTMTLAGPSAVFVDAEAERWLHARTAATDVTHVVHAPSARRRRGRDLEIGLARSPFEPGDDRDRRADWHGAQWLAVGVPRHSAATACTSRFAGSDQTYRAAWIHDRRLLRRPNRDAVLQVGRENRTARGNRSPRAVSHDGAAPVRRV
jgi:hypothetical protein